LKTTSRIQELNQFWYVAYQKPELNNEQFGLMGLAETHVASVANIDMYETW